MPEDQTTNVRRGHYDGKSPYENLEHHLECDLVVVRGGRVLWDGKRSISGDGIQGVLEDWGAVANVVINIDASSAVGFASRTGLGKVRHLALSQVSCGYKTSPGK